MTTELIIILSIFVICIILCLIFIALYELTKRKNMRLAIKFIDLGCYAWCFMIVAFIIVLILLFI